MEQAGELAFSKQVKLRLPQNYVSRQRWLRDRQDKALGSELGEITRRVFPRAGCAHSNVLSDLVPLQAASNRPGRAGGARGSFLALEQLAQNKSSV